VIDRRTFIGSVMGGILAAPLAAEAQHARKAVRIGILAGNRAASPRTLESFLQGLHDLGIEGSNVGSNSGMPRGPSGSPLL
jgi:hypothetical protein